MCKRPAPVGWRFHPRTRRLTPAARHKLRLAAHAAADAAADRAKPALGDAGHRRGATAAHGRGPATAEVADEDEPAAVGAAAAVVVTAHAVLGPLVGFLRDRVVAVVDEVTGGQQTRAEQNERKLTRHPGHGRQPLEQRSALGGQGVFVSRDIFLYHVRCDFTSEKLPSSGCNRVLADTGVRVWARPPGVGISATPPPTRRRASRPPFLTCAEPLRCSRPRVFRTQSFCPPVATTHTVRDTSSYSSTWMCISPR